MSLFGLLLCGLGWGYAVHKDKQKFANMQADAVRESGRGVVESIDDVSITNKYYREVKKYFDDRYDYYINNRDYIMSNTNIKNYIGRDDIDRSLDELQQLFAGWLAYEDLCAKYAPDYVRLAEQVTHMTDHYCPGCFADIARALARKEVYRMGFKPSHMANMNCRLDGKGLYFYTGTFGSAMDAPTEYDYNRLSNENPFKYHTDYDTSNKIYYARIEGKNK